MYLRTGKHTIKKIENLGEFITLDDNSRWKVSFIDKTKSMMWMITDEVNVTSYLGDKFKITHIKKKETIEATNLS
jgi:hypothetical protein